MVLAQLQQILISLFCFPFDWETIVQLNQNKAFHMLPKPGNTHSHGRIEQQNEVISNVPYLLSGYCAVQND